MTIAVRDLNDLDPDAVVQNLEEAVARVQEQNPSLDMRRGANHDILAYFHALLATQLQANVADYLAARSLLAIQQDPALADPALVDHVLSNFGVTRRPGGAAAGEVTIVVSADVTLTLASGSRFRGAGKFFRTTQAFTAKAEAAQVNNDSDRLLAAQADGNFAFTVPVVAEEDGPASELAKDAAVVPLTLPANYVTSYAASSFAGGVAVETNAELLARLQEGPACKAPSNRVNMAALLRQQDDFAAAPALSVVGMGDPEMLRDKHWIFPVGGGGRVDLYVRGAERLARVALAKTAVCLEADGGSGSLWQLAVGRDDAPGFYELGKVRRAGAAAGAAGFAVEDETRALDLTGPGFKPDVVGLVEGDYTRFATAVVRFRDTEPGPAAAAGDEAAYELEASCTPLVGPAQDFMSAPDTRSRVADVLVKAPVPCFVKVGFTVYKAAGQDDPDVAAMAEAVSAAVNGTGFTGLLFASDVQAAVAPHLGGGQSTGAVDLFGRIRRPGGGNIYVRSSAVLEVPDLPGELVSARTVQFFTEPADVSITVAIAGQPDF